MTKGTRGPAMTKGPGDQGTGNCEADLDISGPGDQGTRGTGDG